MTPAPPEMVALLAACRARPGDDLPRLVLADWLDENGQPERAEFVRVQVELSHPTADVERIRRVKKREMELLAEHESEWAGGYQAAAAVMAPPRPESGGRMVMVPPGPPPHRFVRGLLRVGNITRFAERPELREWLRSPELPWLEQVDFGFDSGGWFERMDLPDELHGRIGLTLRVGETPPGSRRELFRRLAVSGNFAHVRSFTVLGGAGEPALDEITKAEVANLVAVSVDGDEAQRAAGLVASSPFASLSSLHLGRLTDAGVRALAASPHLGNLTHLNLLACTIGDGGMAALCRSRLAESLRSVEFPNTGISDAGVTALVASPLFGHMHGPRLNLMMNRIGDDGLKAIAASEHLLRFRELVLRENVVGDAGIEALAASPFAANLQFLDFWRNRITDRGAMALAKSPHLNKVVDLSVKENAVTAAGATALHERFGERAKT